MRHLALLTLLAAALLPAGALTLTSERLAAEIDDATGVVVRLGDRRDGTVLLQPSPDRYALQPSPEQEFTATERDDHVSGQPAPGTLVATNPALPGVAITKQYALSDAWLEKTVTFRAERADVGLLKYTVTSTVDPAFYADGYLNDPSRHPLKRPYLPTSSLTEERPMRDYAKVADHHWAIFTNLPQGRGLAQYRLKVDGRYVHPISSYSYEPGLTYGPTGWRVAVAGKWLSSDREPLAATTRWHLFDGDHVAFHQAYQRLPEYQAQWRPMPDWVADVRATAGWNWGSSSFRLDNYQRMAESLDHGYVLVTLGDVFCNTRDFLSDPIATPKARPLPAAQLEQFVSELQAVSPKIKVGPITWQWAFGELDPVFAAHPEWTVHDGEGKPVFGATGWNYERVYSQLLSPEALAHNLAQYEGAVDRYGFDFIYMDTGQGGVTRFDWRTRTNAQDYDWADFYKGIQDAARRKPGGMTFYNGTPGLYTLFADCGYFEGVGFIKPDDWRAIADRLVLVKLYQPGERWTMPLYWRPDNFDEYLDLCYTYGLKPQWLLTNGTYNRWPMVQAAEELVGARLTPEAEPRPCWWREETETEAYALALPQGGGVLTLYHHGAPGEVAASCAVAPLGLDPARPIHAWAFRPRTASDVAAAVRLTEADAHDLFRREGSAPYRVMVPEYLGTRAAVDGRFEVALPLETRRPVLVLLTQAGELAHAVDGRPTQLLLPPPAGRAAQTVAADAPLPADLVARREGYVLPETVPTSPALVGERSTPESQNERITPVDRGVAGLGVERLIAVDCDHNDEDTAAAAIEGDAVRLVADMGLHKTYGFAGAAMEAAEAGALQLRLRLAKPYYGEFTSGIASCFVGLVADYHTAGGYSERVRFGLIPVRAEGLTLSRPWWGANPDGDRELPPRYVDLSGTLAPGDSAELTLDLGRWAPAGWDGRVVFGPVLESCGLGSRLEVDVVGNGPAGARDETAFSPIPLANLAKGTPFHGAAIIRFESNATQDGDRILFPPEGLIEADGLRVLTWHVRREAESKALTLMINYQLESGKYELVYRDLTPLVPAGSESTFDIDLNEFAPKGWNGYIRMRLRGDGMTAALTGNTAAQMY